jgi:hypothetical protein
MLKAEDSYLRRVRLNSQGYDAQGCYYGTGAPLYRAEAFWRSPDSGAWQSECHEFRGMTRDNAKRAAQEHFAVICGVEVKFR